MCFVTHIYTLSLVVVVVAAAVVTIVDNIIKLSLLLYGAREHIKNENERERERLKKIYEYKKPWLFHTI